MANLTVTIDEDVLKKARMRLRTAMCSNDLGHANPESASQRLQLR